MHNHTSSRAAGYGSQVCHDVMNGHYHVIQTVKRRFCCYTSTLAGGDLDELHENTCHFLFANNLRLRVTFFIQTLMMMLYLCTAGEHCVQCAPVAFKCCPAVPAENWGYTSQIIGSVLTPYFQPGKTH